MKRFIVATLSVAVFFFGLGALVEKTAAQFKSDPTALDLIQKARLAIGGDAAIASVESMRIVGRTTHNFDFDGQVRAESGEMEIALRFPNSMSRTFRIGNGADGAEKQAFSFTMLDHASPEFAAGLAAGAGHSARAFTLRKADGSLESVDPATVEKILAERKVTVAATAGEAKDRTIVLSRDGEVITAPEAVQVFMRKAEVEAAAAAGGSHRVIVRTPEGTFKDTDGTMIIGSEGKELRALGAARGAAPLAVAGVRQNEMLRTTLALLLTAPQGTDVTYTYGGESVIEGTACNIVVATSGASSYKIYLSQSTSLPVAMSYSGSSAPRVMFKRDSGAGGTGVGSTTYKTAETPSEVMVTYSDFRSVNGVLLPHRWTQSSGNVVNETVDVMSYEINPANIGEKFQNPHVLVRTKKDGN